MENTIKPRLLKGFRDFIGEQAWQRRQVMQIFIETFEKYGYEPLETPALEYFDILMGKYGEQEKLVYNFEDFGGRKVALKYDLTVPASRVMAQYSETLTMPWKRYQMQPVWRADNTQKGRFREFWQCDADTFGTASMIADAEYISMGMEIISRLGFKDFKVQLNNRKILNAIAEYSGRPEKFMDIVYVIDDWAKRTVEDNKAELMKRELSESETSKIVELMQKPFTNNDELLAFFAELLKDTQEGPEGVRELQEIVKLVNDPRLEFTPSIARGLSYYTGPVWEWVITEGGVGSVGGCGRYDKLIGSFLGRDIPATGGSFGFERIMEVLTERGMLPETKTKLQVLVTVFNENLISESFALAAKLREQGIATMVYPDAKALKKQFEFANKKGIPYVVIIGEDEIKSGTIALKDMLVQRQELLNFEAAVKIIKSV